jgi:hypothetical protein
VRSKRTEAAKSRLQYRSRTRTIQTLAPELAKTFLYSDKRKSRPADRKRKDELRVSDAALKRGKRKRLAGLLKSVVVIHQRLPFEACSRDCVRFEVSAFWTTERCDGN